MDMRPAVFLLISLVVMWLGVVLGSRLRERRLKAIEDELKIITVLEGALLTLFGLLIGFTFSMAVSRYDLRKELVVQEANAVGKTWLRTALLGEPTRSVEQALLRQYLSARMEYVTAGSDWERVNESLKHASELQARSWGLASNYATDHRDVTTSLFLSSLNESIDLAEERLAAEQNRIPGEAWWMLLFVGLAAMIMVGLDVRPTSRTLQLVLPLVLAAALFLTMDLDSPRYGLIKIDQPSFDRLAPEIMHSLPHQEP